MQRIDAILIQCPLKIQKPEKRADGHCITRGVLSGKVGTGMCGPDRVPFRPLRFTNGPFFI